MNNFEKYLQANKEKMQLESVNPDIWLTMENKLLRKKNRKNIFYLKLMAAAAAILLLVAVAVGLYAGDTGQDPLVALEQYQPLNQKITLKTQQLASAKIPVDRQEDFQILLQQVQFLDSQYADYLQYIEQNGYQEFIGQQILQYYKTKIDLLDKIQQEIEKINYYENKFESKSEKIGLQI